jgi:eukaryotic-like serine/threonine-protein kinase
MAARSSSSPNSGTTIVGRYALHDRIASGGMATVYLGRLLGPVGFSRTVAIKRLHPHLLGDPSFADMFADEAKLAARVRHPNVVPTVDVLNADGELLLVMEYVDGESLSKLFKLTKKDMPRPIAVAVVSEMLHGLHAAHEAQSEDGEPLGIVHRDVSPQNVLVGADGVARLLDFGIARAHGRMTNTREGDVKGKLAYMAPEQVRCEVITRRTDVFAAGVVLWELLTGQRLFASDNDGATIEKILVGWVAPPSSIVKDVPASLDAIALRALDPNPEKRFATAREMAVALEDALPRALGRDVAAWVEKVARKDLEARRLRVANIERTSDRALAVAAPAQSSPKQLERTVVERKSDPPAAPFDMTWLVATRPVTAPMPITRRPRFAVHAIAAVAFVIILLGVGVRSIATARATPRTPVDEAAQQQPAQVQPVAPAASTASSQVASASAATAPAADSPAARPAAKPKPVPSPSPPARKPAWHAGKGAPAARPAGLRAGAPCIARYDAASKKTVYEGDCE